MQFNLQTNFLLLHLSKWQHPMSKWLAFRENEFLMKKFRAANVKRC